MSADLNGATASVALPVAAPAPASPLIERLVSNHGASWVTLDTVDAWAAAGGDRVLFLSGDPVRFPEALDVAVVLPELAAHFPHRLAVGVALREHEDAIARRYGSIRWPALVFVRDGEYVTTLSGMLDWDVYVQRVGEALEMPTSRAPTVGIPVRTAGAASESSCH